MSEEDRVLALVKPVIDLSVRSLCVAPYPDHKKGCPNFNHKLGCPPKAKKIYELINLDKPIYAVWNRFDLGAHVEKMCEKHPDWSERQLYCCLWWQPKARKQLKLRIMAAMRGLKELMAEGLTTEGRLVLVACPEAAGVDVTKTMANIGIELEWPPRKYAYQVVLIGYEKG